MLIKNLEKLRKRTLRERIYEEIVHLILSGELPSGGWVGCKFAGNSDPLRGIIASNSDPF